MNARVVVPLVLAALLAGCTDFSDEDAALSIRSIDVSAPEVGAGRFVLAVHVTLDNEGGRTGDVNATVKAFDGSTGLLVGTAQTAAGRLAKDRTHAIEVRIELPRAASYRLSIDIEEEDQLVYRTTVNAGNLAALEPNLYDTGLRIAASDFRVLSTAGNRTTIQASIYLTNEGATDSRPLSLQVKAREDSTDLLVDEEWASVGAVRRDATDLVNVTLSMPDRYNYVVEATLWDGDIIVERGEGRVQFAPTATVDPGRNVVVSTPDLTDFQYDRGNSADSASKTPGLGLGMVAAALVALVALRRRTA